MAEKNSIELGNVAFTDQGDWISDYNYIDENNQAINGYDANDLVHTEKGVFLSLEDNNTTNPNENVEKWRSWLNVQAIIDEVSKHPQRVGLNGNWEKWDVAKQSYVDTEIAARGGIFYPSFDIDGNDLVIDDGNSMIVDRFVMDGNELSIIL